MNFKLREMRLKLQISQEKLARICDMSVTNIQRYEQNRMKSVPFATLEMFCTVFNCQPGDLIERIPIDIAGESD